MTPEQTKAIALDAKRQQRKHEYLKLPHAHLVKLLCEARHVIMKRNQMIRTLSARLTALEKRAAALEWEIAACAGHAPSASAAS